MLDLQLNENAISWATKVERPMPMKLKLKLKFKGIIDGRSMAGTVKFGVFASGTFSRTCE